MINNNIISFNRFFLLVLVIFLCNSNFAQNSALFEDFTYIGNDDYYKLNPLKDQESFYNPILPGFYPDPSICRRGNDYFLVNSTFSYFPGLPIFHSKDLVNWHQIGNVINRTSQLSLTGLGVNEGLYAPSITYNPHNRMFYLVCTNIGKRGNFVVKTDDPFKCNWSDPVYLKFNGIDPSMFIDDDGKAYIVNNGDPEVPSRYDGHKAAWLQEFDTQTDKMVGPRRVLRDGGFRPQDKPIWIEGPHVYKIKGEYYLMTAEGGTGDGHSEVIYKSSSVWGEYKPYLGNPILTQRTLSRKRTNPTTNSGHADLIDTPNGEFWAVFLACRPFVYPFENLGRETFMMPAKWNADGFPVITQGNDTIPWIVKRKGVKRTKETLSGNFTVKDDFNSSQLNMKWLMLRTPDTLPYSLTQNKGFLTLPCLPVSITERKTPAAILRRIQHHKFIVITNMQFKPQNDKEAAGLVIFKDEFAQYNCLMTLKDGKRILVVSKSISEINDGKKQLKQLILSESTPIMSANITLKIVSNGSSFSFFYSIDKKHWIKLGDDQDAKVLSTENAGGFTGTTIGMYATSNFSTKAH